MRASRIPVAGLGLGSAVASSLVGEATRGRPSGAGEAAGGTFGDAGRRLFRRQAGWAWRGGATFLSTCRSVEVVEVIFWE